MGFLSLLITVGLSRGGSGGQFVRSFAVAIHDECEEELQKEKSDLFNNFLLERKQVFFCRYIVGSGYSPFIMMLGRVPLFDRPTTIKTD